MAMAKKSRECEVGVAGEERKGEGGEWKNLSYTGVVAAEAVECGARRVAAVKVKALQAANPPTNRRR